MERQPLQLLEGDEMGRARRELDLRGDDPYVQAKMAAQFARSGAHGDVEMREAVNGLLARASSMVGDLIPYLNGKIQSRQLRNKSFQGILLKVRDDIESDFNTLQGMHFFPQVDKNRFKGNLSRRLYLLKRTLNWFQDQREVGKVSFSANDDLKDVRSIGAKVERDIEDAIMVLNNAFKMIRA